MRTNTVNANAVWSPMAGSYITIEEMKRNIANNKFQRAICPDCGKKNRFCNCPADI